MVSSASDRHSAGYEYAKENYASLIAGVQEGETFKLVSHSMGGAFSTGIQQYLEEQGWSVDASIFINTYQSDDIKTQQNGTTFIVDYQNTNDPVLFWFDTNLGKGKIKNSNLKIREKSEKEWQYIHKSPFNLTFWNNLENMFDYQNRNTLTWQDAMNQINIWRQQNPNITVTYY